MYFASATPVGKISTPPVHLMFRLSDGSKSWKGDVSPESENASVYL